MEDWDETSYRIDQEVENMTSEDIYNFITDCNKDSLWDLERKIMLCGLDRDWIGVEAHTKTLLTEIKNILWERSR